MDFEAVKSAELEFLDRESSDGRLYMLFNNAGTGGRKNAPKGLQGYEYHMTVNALGSFILTELLPTSNSYSDGCPAGVYSW